MYQRGVASIAEQIKKNKEIPATKEDIAEAKSILEGFFKTYPKAKEWMEGNKEKAHKVGYVEDLWGRRRHLPDAQLPKYTFELEKKEDESSVNPLLGATVKTLEPSKALVAKYTEKLDKARSKEARNVIIAEAKKDGLIVHSNTGFIASAERQAINSPIQGGSATMTKIAMRNMHWDPELNELDFHLLFPVHDEVIGEAPVWNAERAKDRLEEIMIHAGDPVCEVPMKADADIFSYWYSDLVESHVKEDFGKYLEQGMTREEAINKIYVEYEEFLPEVLDQYIPE